RTTGGSPVRRPSPVSRWTRPTVGSSSRTRFVLGFDVARHYAGTCREVAEARHSREARMLRRTLLTALLLAGLAPDVRAQTPPARARPDQDEALLRRAGVGGEDAVLLRLVRERTRVEPVDPKTLDALIVRLGDEQFAERDKAYRELHRLGRAALPALHHH